MLIQYQRFGLDKGCGLSLVEGFKKQLSKVISFPVAMSIYCTSTHDNVCALDIEKEINPNVFPSSTT